MQLHVEAKCTNLKLLVDIIIGTVPLREVVQSLPAAQFQTVFTHQSPSAPPIQQPISDNFNPRMSSLCCRVYHRGLRLTFTVFVL